MKKTIRQIADEIGVSKQAIHQKIKKNKELSVRLQPFTSTVDGTIYIDIDGENTLKSSFLKNLDIEQVDANCKQVDVNQYEKNTDERLIEILKNTIQTLQSQLTIKDEQIELLQEELKIERQHSRDQLERVSVLVDQSQQLQLAQLNKISNQIECKANDEKQHWWKRKK